MESTSIYAALAAVQSELKAPKGQMNTFGGYRYRSCEDILEAVKPILKAHDLLLTLSDEPKVLEGCTTSKPLQNWNLWMVAAFP